MADDKEPMEGDGADLGKRVANENDPPSAGRPDMEDNQGDSGGGPYPSPHNDPGEAHSEDGFMGHGGQSDNRYYGGGEPGTDRTPERENAVTEDGD